MSTIGYVILALAVVWILQIIGTYFQMQHYRRVLGQITSAGSEGYVGVGNAKATFGKGAILIVVADTSGFVTRALRMRGMTVFARFKEAPDLIGLSLEELRHEEREGPYDKSTMLAVRRAIEQIDRIKEEKAKTATISQG